MPLTVAIDLVNRFTMAVESSTRKTEIRPNGISVLPMRILGGTFQPRSPWYFQRKTSMARLLNVNDQITPNAYASPSMMTLPRQAMIVIICRMKTMLTMRWLVPNLGCGLRNQSVRTPSSATRISTPVEPIIDVLMAPERIRKPTSTTKMRNAIRQNSGPTMYMASPAIRLSW